ncbi:hypothetical protein [Polynucleobacter sp. UK-Gri1-W3]|uniref:hypothetical protein n=1 Tax=Polynucleobacter sp. UK-Gri1-W3 TaxID=1819737 RepID=UPI001C0E1544|nr:hypothetical protein [Polynucleobacter sp. UK-Gri1-W3]MBU3538242.1 hypothetical protein [Polynucleobacter sp. UK-Gri1-W3]
MLVQRWGVLGGGFGLYGYIPALASNPLLRAIVLAKHHDVINKRPELRQYLPMINFVSTREEILTQSDSLIISVPPLIQKKYLMDTDLKKYKYLILEKPLAAVPIDACSILKRSIELSDSIRIGYSFLNTDWGRELIKKIEKIDSMCEIEITWHFYAHYFGSETPSWKGDHNQGGGPLRFYGIQLIALLGKAHDLDVKYSAIVSDKFLKPYQWQAEFVNSQGAKIRIELNCRSKSEKFQIRSNSRGSLEIFTLRNPFSNETAENGSDKRVGILSQIINSLDVDNQVYYRLYSRINEIWRDIESKTDWNVAT